MDEKNSVKSREKPIMTANRQPSILLAGFALSLAIAMSFSFYLSREMTQRYVPLAEAVMEVKLEITTAHLWFEEVISGDQTIEIEQILRHIKRADWYAQAMLEGGENSKHQLVALVDSDFRHQVTRIASLLQTFGDIVEQRWRDQSLSGIGSKPDQQLDSTFVQIIASADELEIALHKTLAAQRQQLLPWQVLLVVLTLLVGAITSVVLYRHDRRRLSDIQALHHKEENLRITLDSIGDGVIVTDSDGNVTSMNPVAESLTGWSLAAACGKPLSDVFVIVNAKTMEPVDNPAELVFKSGSTVGLANGTMLIAKGGERHQIADSGAPIRCPDGTVIGVVIVFRDVTQYYRSESVLRALAETSSSETEDIFKKIVRQIALAHNMRYAMISLINDQNPTQADTVAVWSGDGYVENRSYSLTGSPCENVVKGESCYYPNNLQSLFPDDEALVGMEAEGYLGFPLKNSQNKIIGLLNIIDDKPISDISEAALLLKSLAARASIELERREAERKLKLLARVFSDTREGICITDASGTMIDVNPAFCAITGYRREEVVGHNPKLLQSGKHGPQFYAEMWQALNEYGFWKGEIWNRRKDGDLCAELISISALIDDQGDTLNYVAIFSDITSSKKQQETLALMAHYDVLTKLPNRVLFADRFLQAIAHSKRTSSMLAVCFLDLDNFKPINDQFGHDVGDQLLIDVAGRIKANIREEDTVSRQGGDEFALLLGGLGAFDPCEQMLKRILHSLAQPFLIKDLNISISASIGVTLYPLDDNEIGTLIRHADQAMYQAKLAGKNRYHLFNTELDQQISYRHQRLEEIQQALLNDEFCLYYQPKVNMKTGQVFGVEALIRWQHPQKGMIPPFDFLPIIEGTELEIQVGEWVIGEALTQLDKWREQGIEPEVSVNIASYHLQSPTFFQQLQAALSAYPDINPRYLQLEVLESSALGDIGMVSLVIKQCQEILGVGVALDDFGTGYSALTHIRNLAAETIKIDREFVGDMLDDADDLILINGIISLAKSFDRSLVAEGVETTAQGLVLLLMGCEQAQGYGIARPMPAEAIPGWLSSYVPNEQWLACGNSGKSSKENKVELVKIAVVQWMTCFETAIHSVLEGEHVWPIMDSTKCICGSWLIREKHAKLFSVAWLGELDRAHDRVHDMADTLRALYLDGEREAAIEGLSSLSVAAKELVALFDQAT